MKQSKSNKKETYQSGEKKTRERSREKEIQSEISKFSIINAQVNQASNAKKESYQISLEESREKFDSDNLEFLQKNEGNPEFKEIYEYIQFTSTITPSNKQKEYIDNMNTIIDSLKKSKTKVELPKLPYGHHLSDEDFLKLLKECVCYASYNLKEENLMSIKKQLQDNSNILEKIFTRDQIEKDILQNALLTSLVSDNEEDQNDNLELLFNAQNSTCTPLMKMDFNLNQENKDLDRKELIDIFNSKIYLHYYYKTLEEFIPNFKSKIKTENQLRERIENYFNNHHIYFCQLPKRLFAISIHSGNIYLKSDYLQEFYNEKKEESKIIIREKIILNIAHELMHILIREINSDMADNFLIRSKKINKVKDNKIQFVEKFNSSEHDFDANESGNVFDHNFFGQYYFDELYKEEAFLFLDIKNIDTVKEYQDKLKSIILNEKTKKVLSSNINKFKKFDNYSSRCKRPGAIRIDDE